MPGGAREPHRRLRSSGLLSVLSTLVPLVCLGCLLGPVRGATPVLVTVATQSMPAMQALTRQIDEVAQAESTRVLLGAIEATMSRVVDSDSLSVVTRPVAVPTMSLLSGVSFNAENRVWTMSYRTTRMDPQQELNNFRRVLYLSKQGNMPRGDPKNPCLAEGVTDTTCVTAFDAEYLTPATPASDGDRLAGSASYATVSVEDKENSLEQTITVSIPHAQMRSQLASEQVVESELWGAQKRYVFGIGMLFLAAEGGRHVVISDVFTVIESSAQKLTVSAENSYSVATFAEFYTSVVRGEVPAQDFRTVSITYVLKAGEHLQKIDVAMRAAGGTAGDWQTVSDVTCTATQAVLEGGLQACLGAKNMCTPEIISVGDGASAVEWVRVLYPVPAAMQSSVDVNTLLQSSDAANRTVLSTVDFTTLGESEEACKDAVVTTFDPTTFVSVNLYRGSATTAEVVDARHGIHVQNETVLLASAMSMADSMLTVAMQPRDGHQDYFASGVELMRLDQVYMSHALVGVTLPQTVENTMTTAASGRASLDLDSGLATTCPVMTDNTMQNNGAQCVTSHDWDLVAKGRGNGAGGTYFVHEVTVGDDDPHTQWLKDNVLGASDSAQAAAIALLTTARTRLSTNGRVYWILPLMYWPDQSPVGLVDTTIISLAWSVSRGSTSGRRLLEAPPAPPTPPTPTAHAAATVASVVAQMQLAAQEWLALATPVDPLPPPRFDVLKVPPTPPAESKESLPPVGRVTSQPPVKRPGKPPVEATPLEPPPKREATPEVKREAKREAKPSPKPEAKPSPKPEAKPSPKPEVKPEAKPSPKPSPQPSPKPSPQPSPKPKPSPQPSPQPSPKPSPSPEPPRASPLPTTTPSKPPRASLHAPQQRPQHLLARMAAARFDAPSTPRPHGPSFRRHVPVARPRELAVSV